jgi:hypothetical protein
MALPKYVKREHLDDGIANVVININKIPGIGTMTTCEGHVWRDTPMWPAKNGWIHFHKEKGLHDTLIDSMKKFCDKNSYFSIDNYVWDNIPNIENFTINANFEDHTCFDYFHNSKELADYFDRVDKEKKHILDGWNELNKLVVGYIKKKISQNINNLSYRK